METLRILILGLALLNLFGCKLNNKIDVNFINGKVNLPTAPAPVYPELAVAVTTKPASLSFLTSAPVVFTLTNPATIASTDLVLSVSTPGSCVVANSLCSASLNAGNSCSVTMTFTGSKLTQDTCEINVQYKLNNQPKTATVTASTPVTLPGVASVAKVYPTNGSAWNDYVLNNDPSKDLWTQSGAACEVSALPGALDPPALHNFCVHGAELLKVYTGMTSCTDLSIQEDLNAFNWKCVVKDSKAYFFSQSLKLGKGLRDLITSSGWKNNRVKIYKNSDLLIESSLAPWWDNSVQILPDNSTGPLQLTGTSANGKGIIYYHDNDRTVRSYQLGDKSAVVSLNSKKLKPLDSIVTDNYCRETLTATNCVLFTQYKKFVWIEAEIEYTTTAQPKSGIHIDWSHFIRIENTTIHGRSSFTADKAGLFMNFGRQGIIRNLSVAGFYTGVHLRSGNTGFLFESIYSKMATKAFHVDLSNSDSIFRNLYLMNSTTGLDYNCNTGNNLVQGVSVMNVTNGSKFQAGDGTFSHKLQSFLSVNSGLNAISSGLSITSGYINVTNIAVTNSLQALSLGDPNPSQFSGVLMLGNNTANCAAPDNNGLIDGTCADSLTDGISTYGASTSNAILRTNRSATASFVGRVSTNDLINPLDTNGTLLFSSLVPSAINTFNSPLRSWGVDSANWSDSAAKGRCSIGTCRIYDWQLATNDRVFKNVSGDGDQQNEAFISGLACPSALDGNKSTTSIASNPSEVQTYLNNAWEILYDGEGDEDGLCESGESCLYTPNIGAYQGWGEILPLPCLFNNGAVSNVKVYTSVELN